MPRPTAILICLTIAALSVRATHAQSAANAVSVTGEAEIRVVPDEVVLTLGVETFDLVLKTAKDANDGRIKRTIGVIQGAGVPAARIQTDYISIEPRYRDGNMARDLLGYVVRRSIVVRLDQIGRFEALLASALEAWVTHVHGVEF